MKEDHRVGKAELRVLEHLADHGSLTVKQVADTLGKEMGVVRTTVLQMMERLRAKGLLSRERIEGVWRYQATTPQEEVRRSVVRRFVRESLGGSLSPFVQYLSEAELSSEDLAELRRLVERLEDRP